MIQIDKHTKLYIFMIFVISLIILILYNYIVNREAFQESNLKNISNLPVPGDPINVNNNNLFKFIIDLGEDFTEDEKVVPIFKFDKVDTLEVEFINKPINCKVSEFTSASACRYKCGGKDLKGQLFKRSILRQPKYKGTKCPNLTENRDCNTHPCPIDCKLSEWKNEGSCSESCGPGIQKQIKTILVKDDHGGKPCGPMEQNVQCNLKPCPIDCQLSDWKKKGQCSKKCGGGKQIEIKDVIVESDHGGTPCPSIDDISRKKETDCNTHPCPIDCKLSDWKNVGECSESCGGGIQQQERTKLISPQYGGKECDVLYRDIECNTQECPIDCKLGEWKNVGNCSKTCGTGMQKQIREILVNPQFNGKQCGSLSKNIPCNEEPCPEVNTNTNINSTENSSNINNLPNNNNNINTANNINTVNNIENFSSEINDNYGCTVINGKLICTNFIYLTKPVDSLSVKLVNKTNKNSLNNIDIKTESYKIEDIEKFKKENPDANIVKVDEGESSLINETENVVIDDNVNIDNNRPLSDAILYRVKGTDFNNAGKLKTLKEMKNINSGRGKRINSNNLTNSNNLNNTNNVSDETNRNINYDNLQNITSESSRLNNQLLDNESLNKINNLNNKNQLLSKNNINNDPCFQKYKYNRVTCLEDNQCFIEPNTNACMSKKLRILHSLSDKNINNNEVYNSGDFIDALFKMNTSELNKVKDTLNQETGNDTTIASLLGLIQNLLSSNKTNNKDTDQSNKFTRKPNLNEISQKNLKGVGNIFSPRIVIKKKEDRTPKPLSSYPTTYKKFTSKDKNTLEMIDKHSSDYWLKSPNYCGNKIKCQRKGLEEKISKNLNEDKFNNMYNIFPRNPNDVPYRKCVPSKKCLGEPVPTYNNNVFHNAYEYTGIGTILPKFNFHESYNEKDYS